jgi:hypothetical protein
MWDLLPHAKHLFSEANRTGIAPEGAPEAQLGSGFGKGREKLELYPLSLGGFPKNFVDGAIDHTPTAATDQTDWILGSAAARLRRANIWRGVTSPWKGAERLSSEPMAIDGPPLVRKRLC